VETVKCRRPLPVTVLAVDQTIAPLKIVILPC
jgi:hypothetical protein